MNNTDQIRQLLLLMRYEINNGIDVKATITKALTLLPCKTCNGTGKIPAVKIGEIFPDRKLTVPCPDCQSP